MLNKTKYIILFIITGLFSCSDDEEPRLNNKDLVFSNTFRLHIPPYEYIGEDERIYQVSGDTVYITGIPDTINATPEFQWDSVPGQIITVVLFNNPIDVEGSNIKNIDDIIWQWHAGMESGVKGFVKYAEGKPVFEGEIDYEMQPLPLESGLYFWAVWNWTANGKRLLYSSRTMSFFIE